MIFYPFTYEIGTMHDAHTAHARVDRSTRLRSSILFRPTMSRANFTLIKTVTYDCCEPKDRERVTRVKNHRLINQSNLSSSPLLSPFCFQFQVSPKKKKKKIIESEGKFNSVLEFELLLDRAVPLSWMEIDTNDADIGVANIHRERKMEGRNNIIISMESGRP